MNSACALTGIGPAGALHLQRPNGPHRKPRMHNPPTQPSMPGRPRSAGLRARPGPESLQRDNSPLSAITRGLRPDLADPSPAGRRGCGKRAYPQLSDRFSCSVQAPICLRRRFSPPRAHDSRIRPRGGATARSPANPNLGPTREPYPQKRVTRPQPTSIHRNYSRRCCPGITVDPHPSTAPRRRPPPIPPLQILLEVLPLRRNPAPRMTRL